MTVTGDSGSEDIDFLSEDLSHWWYKRNNNRILLLMEYLLLLILTSPWAHLLTGGATISGVTTASNQDQTGDDGMKVSWLLL